MTAMLLRFARVLVGQLIGIGIDLWGGIQIPIIGMTIGALINAIFKFIRDKFPKATWLVWLPL